MLFTDISDFTRINEELPPDEVLTFLSEYHELMVAILSKHGGPLEKFIGDAIMATYSTSVTAPDDHRRALEAALKMEKALDCYNERRASRGQPPIRHGFGIHYGPAMGVPLVYFSRALAEQIGDGLRVKRVASIATK